MRRLLIHAGYPKAASTTLQNNVFLPLHNTGEINFLGRAFESGYLGKASEKRTYKGWLDKALERKPSRIVDYEHVFYDCAKAKTNVYSEGLFLMNEMHATRFTAASRLHAIFQDKAELVEVLLVIRAQATPLPSYFIQTYAKHGHGRIADFLDHEIQNSWKGRAKIFDFDALVASFEDVLGSRNVHILLFEDLVKQPIAFGGQLAELLDVPLAAVSELLKREPRNRTPRAEGASIVEKPRLTPFEIARRLTGRVLPNVAAKWVQLIPEVTKDEVRTIRETFAESNRRLATRRGLDHDAMRRYGYF